ncbi:hypothetical protein D2T29_05175 [Sinirhodobacter populi]|uniref:Uncharacterized protein n=1 Tax=Paenirhodobacter populi TaxID=2306993 RepID=A0A443KLW5_9RHOB|nr:hypothetical protein [Sinirhodobacter populi]RWR33667.1 hypothetical protein D2T29_05175 [Sinirhodobacter populi]
MKELELHQRELRAFLLDAEDPPPLLHPNMAHHYRRQIKDLHQPLQEDDDARPMTAADIIRSLVKEIVLTPEGSELKIDLRGDLAGILAISLDNKSPPEGRADRNCRWLLGAGSTHRFAMPRAIIPPCPAIAT